MDKVEMNAQLLKPTIFKATSTQCEHCGEYGTLRCRGSLVEWCCDCDPQQDAVRYKPAAAPTTN